MMDASASRLSSKATFYHKRVFPVLFYGIVLLVCASTFVIGYLNGELPPWPFFIAPVLMIVISYYIFRKVIFDLVDEVFDLGDALLIRNDGKEDRVKLSDITNISYTTLINPPRVTLSLRQPTIFGREITFCPPLSFIPFKRSPVVDDLIARVDAARRRSV